LSRKQRFTKDLLLFRNLVARQIRQDYLENLTGFGWLIIQPLILLAVYAFVFSTIFQARLPESAGVGFVPFLAVAFWPWTAFSESIIKASGSIRANSALIGKVAFATELLPLANVTATFLMNAAGYVAVLAVLAGFGVELHLVFLPLVALLFFLFWMLASAIAMVTCTLQVFIKDVAQMLPPLMTFWFFTTPIVYSPEVLPANLSWIADWNLAAWFVGMFRSLLLFGSVDVLPSWAVMLVLIPVLFWLGLRFLRRFSGHFEDFL
jgi:ABC-type polysaccharide/polyol phosphate export permease